MAASYVEMPVQQMRTRSWARLAFHLCAIQPRQLVGYVVKRGGNASRRVERAAATVAEDKQSERRHILNRDMITPFLAFAENADRTAGLSLPPKSVGSVAAMRVARAADQGWSQHCYRRLG
jgi:hypothetical protein